LTQYRRSLTDENHFDFVPTIEVSVGSNRISDWGPGDAVRTKSGPARLYAGLASDGSLTIPYSKALAEKTRPGPYLNHSVYGAQT